MIFVAAIQLTACEPTDPPQPADQSHLSQPRSPWHKQGDTSVIGIDDATIERELQAAIEQARNTADDARLRWMNTSEHERAGRYFIKWAAPTVDQSVEYVWVQLINWSPFRIEGVLASAPVHSLMANKTQGDLVSFPIEELSDWVYFLGPSDLDASTSNGEAKLTPNFDSSQPHEGGFTIEVLEKHFGRPSSAR